MRRRVAICSRRAPLRVATGLAVAAWLCLAACRPAPPVFPDANLILVSVDTLRADHLGTYGYERPTSPFLDSLAAEGIVFEQAIAQSTWTMPSHAALFTSRYPSEMGLRWYPDPGRIPDDFVTLAQVLRGAGLRTAAVTDGGFVKKRWGFGRGFESYSQRARRFRHNLPVALERIGELADERFFFFLHTYDVHSYERNTPFLGQFLRPYDGPLRTEQNLLKNIQGGFNQAWIEKLTPADIDYLVDLYDAEIRYVDAELERFANRARELGIWDESIVVVTSDHGEEFLEHGRTGHGYTQFDEQVRVPLIVRLPGAARAGTRVAAQVRSIDVMPTVLELLAVREGLPEMRGTSLLPLLDGPGEPLLAITDPGHHAEVSVRTLEWKVIYRPRFSSWSAFDLSTDPGEQKEVQQPLPAEPERLRRLLLDWHERTPEGPTSEASPLSDDEREELRALGYIE